jgi:hypothetical protein
MVSVFMARRRYFKKRRSGKRKMTLPLAIVAPIASVAFFEGQKLMAGQYTTVLNDFTGYENGKFSVSRALPIYGPIVLGAGIHILASKFGLNRAIASAGVPFVRV